MLSIAEVNGERQCDWKFVMAPTRPWSRYEREPARGGRLQDALLLTTEWNISALRYGQATFRSLESLD
jgi:hypothetical protein